MTIVKIAADGNGAHSDQTVYNKTIAVEQCWAYLPEDVATPDTENFPYADIETETVAKEGSAFDPEMFGDRDVIDVVTKWIPKEPFEPTQPEPEPQEPTEEDDINAMLIDHELRIMDLELGITE